MDKIKIKNLHIYAYHGVHDEEKENGQNFYVNSTIYTDTYQAGHSDNLEDTVSYADVCRMFNNFFTKEKFDLIETVAETIACEALYRFKAIRKIDVEVRKPEAPIGLNVESVSVDITRGWNKSYLAIGSNMGDKSLYIERAINLLKEDKNIRVLKVSDLIVTKPYGGVEQDDFLNGAIEIETLYPPFELLNALQEIEYQCERKREIHWGPRTLDLDILFYEDLIIDSEKLTIPHVDMANRDFVLGPLKQIAPHMIHPVEGISVSRMYDYLVTAD